MDSRAVNTVQGLYTKSLCPRLVVFRMNILINLHKNVKFVMEKWIKLGLYVVLRTNFLHTLSQESEVAIVYATL